MRSVAVIADSHFHEHSRFDECRRLHAFIASDLARRKVDLICHAGDVFETKSTPAERRAVAEWLAAIAENAPVLIVRGNHDAPGDLAIFERLRTRHPIVVEEAAGTHVLGGFAIGALAWPRRAHLLASLGRGTTSEGADQEAQDALAAVLLGVGDRLAEHDLPRLLLAHAMVSGAVTSTGQPLVGKGMTLSLAELALARADMIAIGHIHKGQAWSHDDVPVVYPGSPRRNDFGEVEDKGYVLANFRRRDGNGPWHCAEWTRVATPATPMVHAEHAWTGTAPAAASFGDVAGVEIRLRYDVESVDREAAAPAMRALVAELRACGAVSVKLEEIVRAGGRARLPEVAVAKSVADKLRVFWADRRGDMSRTRTSELLARLAELEDECRGVAARAANGADGPRADVRASGSRTTAGLRARTAAKTKEGEGHAA